MVPKKTIRATSKNTAKPIAKSVMAKKKTTRPASNHATAKSVVYKPFWNIWDTGTQYKVCLLIPGLTNTKIQVEVDDNCLTVSGKREQQIKAENRNYVVREYTYDSWFKSTYLPEEVNTEYIKVTCKDGILKISLDKQTSTK